MMKKLLVSVVEDDHSRSRPEVWRKVPGGGIRLEKPN
jgi:hypothetical protein